MTGSFELFADEGGRFRFRIKAPDGTTMAISTTFPDKGSAVAGIEAVREYAGMGLITDLCPDQPIRRSVDDFPASPVSVDGMRPIAASWAGNRGRTRFASPRLPRIA